MNYFHKSENVLRALALFINLVWICGFLLAEIYRYYPIVGHDFTYIVSHLFDTYLHYRINGLTVEWYTPSFGGGLPSYAHPQQMQFSLVQFLVFFVNPWNAVVLSIFIYLTAGFFCFYLFAKDVLLLEWRASLLGSLFFNVTGFYVGKMISGAFGFMAFPLLAAILLVLFWPRWPDWLAGVILALVVTSLVYQAGFYLLVIFGLSCGLTLPLLYLVDARLFSFPALFKRLSVAVILTLLISASKLYAIYTFMRYFPRDIPIPYSAQYTSSLLPASLFLVTQLLGTTTLVPLMVLAGWNVNLLPHILTGLSGYPISGLWETDNGLSPALILIFMAAVWMLFKSRQPIRFKVPSKDRLLAWGLLLFVTWFTLEYALAKGWWYDLAGQLPILKSLHINFRFISALYFPLALLGALLLHRWWQAMHPQRAWLLFLVLNLITLLSPLSYFLYTEDVHYRIFDVRNILVAYQQSQQGATFPVTFVADANTKDWEAITKGGTTIKPYEPIFGYQLEMFTPQLHPGPVSDLTNGFFNLTNPASLTFPAENGGQLFSRFAASDRQRLEEFVQRRQPDWHISKIQIVLNYVSGISLAITMVMLLWGLRSTWLRSRSRQPAPLSRVSEPGSQGSTLDS